MRFLIYILTLTALAAQGQITTGQFIVPVKTTGGRSETGVTLTNGQVLGKSGGLPAAIDVQPLNSVLTNLSSGTLSTNLTTGTKTIGGNYWSLDANGVASLVVRASSLQIVDGFDGTSAWGQTGFRVSLSSSALTANRSFNFPDESTQLIGAGVISTRPFTMTTARLLGRTTAGTGTIEQLTVGSGLTLSGGSLTANVTSVAGRTGAVTIAVADVTGAQSTSGTLALAGFSSITGTLPLANIAQGGATSGQALTWNGTAWAPATVSNAVSSVAGRTGAVTLSTSDISGLGTIATQAASSVTITGGSITGLTGLGFASGTITTSSPANFTQTWNASGVSFIGLDVNVTRTASASASRLQRWRDGATELAAVSKDGYVLVNPQVSPYPLIQMDTTRFIGSGSGSTLNIGGAGIAVDCASGILGVQTIRMQSAYSANLANTTATITSGTASPEASITGNPGSIYFRNNSGTGELWLKTSGTGNTGWTKVF